MRPAEGFLAQTDWAQARHEHLAGDASARAYERLYLGDKTAVLMDAPPGCGDDIGDFLRIGSHLRTLGLSAPKSYGADESLGFALIEDLGDDLFTKVVAQNPACEPLLYGRAAEVLLHLQAAPPPVGLTDLSAQDWAQSTDLALDFYAASLLQERPERAMIDHLLEALCLYADGPRVLLLRDYHAGNLLWLPQREGLAQVGLLDYQLAQLGQPEYDLVSLLQDARRDVQPQTQEGVLKNFAEARGQSLTATSAAYATLGALRALRIIGIFARLCLVNGKDQYLIHLPRVWGQLRENLAHPALGALQEAVLQTLPEPSPHVIEEIRKKCRKPASL